MVFKVFIVFLCIMLNGFFAMAEIALIRSKKSKLERISKGGRKSADMALHLLNSPGQFLSTVQIGVTLSSIFAGAFGGIQFAEPFAEFLGSLGFPLKFSFYTAFAVLGVFVSYLALVFGELVPKKISLLSPEKVALITAPFMYYLTKLFLPFVFILNISSQIPLSLFNLNARKTADITEEEIVDLLEDGLEAGVIERYEHRVISQIFRLSDLPITSLMTPRTKVIAIPRNSSDEELKEFFLKSSHISYPVFENSLDNIVGFIHTQEALREILTFNRVDIEKILRQPLIVPESKNSLDALRTFQRKKSHIAIIVDEYGGLKGIVTLRDFLKAIMSEFSNVSSYQTPFRRRGDGSWVVSGSVPIETIGEKIGLKFRLENKNPYRTVAGFVLHKLGKIPKEGDFLICENFRIEVIDMDGKRIDKLLFIPLNKKLKR